MDFATYATEAAKTAVYPRVRILLGDTTDIHDAVDAPWLYPLLGAVGEFGELCNQAKKIIRDDNGRLTPTRIASMRKEIGDGLWYVPELARAIGATLKDIAVENLSKLADRAARGALKGSGDLR